MREMISLRSEIISLNVKVKGPFTLSPHPTLSQRERAYLIRQVNVIALAKRRLGLNSGRPDESGLVA